MGVFDRNFTKSLIIRDFDDVLKNPFRYVVLFLLHTVFLGKTYDVSPYDSQRSYPLMDLGVKWDLCVLFVQNLL